MFVAVISLLRTWLISSFMVIQFKLFFFSHQVAAKSLTKIISVDLTGLEPTVVK